MANINRNYKDSVFHLLFGSEQYKQNALELYNAINVTGAASEAQCPALLHAIGLQER